MVAVRSPGVPANAGAANINAAATKKNRAFMLLPPTSILDVIFAPFATRCNGRLPRRALRVAAHTASAPGRALTPSGSSRGPCGKAPAPRSARPAQSATASRRTRTGPLSAPRAIPSGRGPACRRTSFSPEGNSRLRPSRSASGAMPWLRPPCSEDGPLYGHAGELHFVAISAQRLRALDGGFARLRGALGTERLAGQCAFGPRGKPRNRRHVAQNDARLAHRAALHAQRHCGCCQRPVQRLFFPHFV